MTQAVPHLVAQTDFGWVLNKPAGLLSVPGRGPDKQNALSTQVQAIEPQARIVHRLDQATSGLMLMARGDAPARALGLLFQQQQVHKLYLAWVSGRLPITNDWQRIDAPIDRDWAQRPRRQIGAQPGQGKPSSTLWRSLAHHPKVDATCLALRPLTGRTHQLRLHLAHIGHPILGDALYGSPHPDPDMRPYGLMLHAHGLSLPYGMERLGWTCPPPWSVWGLCELDSGLSQQLALS